MAVQLSGAAARAAAPSARAAPGKGGSRNGAHPASLKTQLDTAEAAALLRKAEALARCYSEIFLRAVAIHVHNLSAQAASVGIAHPDTAGLRQRCDDIL